MQVAEHKGTTAAISGGQRGVRQGDRRSLSPSQEVLIRTLLTEKMPDQLKLGFALWTRLQVAIYFVSQANKNDHCTC
ncbi:putative transposase [Pseudomonas sp. TCU-HL1]|nr:putative transposase [Pseudomonas sp. TCU-HL1]